MAEKKYQLECDNPYKILASLIVGLDEPSDVVRIMYDDAYILNRIIKETRSQDMRGRFTDCIIESILEEKSRMEYMKRLDELSRYYFSKLDKARLRKEIEASLKEAGVDISGLVD